MLRLTIRDVVWLTLVLGLAVGWAIDHFYAWRRVRREEAAVDVLIKDLCDTDAEVQAQTNHISELKQKLARLEEEQRPPTTHS